MFEMGEATFALPAEELMGFEQGDGGMSAGYKRAGANNVDSAGNLDTVQVYTSLQVTLKRGGTLTSVFHSHSLLTSRRMMLSLILSLDNEPTLGLVLRE